MATRHEITSIQFKADAGKANAAIDSIRQKAKEANDQMTQLRQKLEEGRKANLPTEDLAKMEAQLKSATKEAKQWGDAQRNLMRGVKALDEAIIQFNRGQGSVEKMSAALSKAARNAAQLQQSRMERGSQGWQEMEALITALDKNLVKARQDFDGLVQTIEQGGRVSVSELSSAKQSLKELSDLTAYGSDEWKQYQAQLNTVTKRFDSLSQTEKRLAGEIVTVEDARKRAAAADADEARWREILAERSKQQATADRERAEGALQIAKTNTAWIEQDIAKTKEQLAAQQQLVGSIEALEDAESQAMSKTMAAETALQKQREETNKFSDATWEAAKKVGELEAKLKELEAQQQSVSTDQQKAEVQQQLAEAQTKLNEAKIAAEGPTKALKEAEEAYTEAQKKEQEATDALNKARGNMNLGEEEQKLEALERQHDDLTESLQKQKQAEQELAENAADTRLKEQEAVIELAQAQNQSEESLKKSVEVLEQQNKTLKAGSAEWMENEQAIGKLNKRIEELKQQSQELRGEVMSLAEAEELADKAMEEQALTTKTGWAASTEELKRAEQTLADKVAKAKRGTAEEEAAYQKLVRQLQAVRTELGAGSMSGKQMMDVLSNPKNVTSVDTLKAAIGRARQELDALGRRIDQARMDGHTKKAEELAEAYDDIAEGAKNADQRMKELQAQSKGTASAFDKAWSRLKTYVGLYVGAAVAMQKLSQAMGDLMTLSDKMGEVRKTTGFTADEVGRLSGNLAKLDTRTTLTQLMELSSLAGSVGLKTQEQVQGFTEAADQLIVALPELGNESARTIIKIANATGDLEKNGGDVRETLEKVGSTIIALRANSASAAGPITDFVSRVGAVGAQAGISIDQIAALGSTIDALGGRVEMSATALSRMIPAIKNNSFAIANSIGVTEKYLKSLAPMEQMVLIFQKMRDNIQHIDTSTEEGMNAMADNVEAMLGKNATMREVMKDLEQQGARAGIVFGLLSQNVDELEKQLGIASEAYRENTALANEFNNMNETTAAKWERLKNQVEEMFVGDQAQRFLGTIIDGLRTIIDLLTGPMKSTIIWFTLTFGTLKIGLGQALASIPVALNKARASATGFFTPVLTGLKALLFHLGLTNRALAAGALEWRKMDAAMKQNVMGLAATAIAVIVYKLVEWKKAIIDVQKELGKWAAEIVRSEKAVNDQFKAVDQASASIDEAKKKVEAARAALEKARKEMNGSKESAERLKKAEDDLKMAEDELRSANDKHTNSIRAINKMYGEYLGFMLSEISSAQELANARELINAKIRETITLKRREAAISRVEEEGGAGRDEAYGALSQALRGAKRTKSTINGREVWTNDETAGAELLKQITELAQAEKMTADQVEKALANAGLNILEKGYNGKQRINAYGANLLKLVMNYRKEYMNVEQQVKDVESQFNAQLSVDRKESQKELGEQYDESVKTYRKLESGYVKATGEARKKAAADLLKQADTLEGMIAAAPTYYDLRNEDEKKAYEQFVKDSRRRINGINKQRDALLKEAGNLYTPQAGGNGSGGNGGGGGTNPYGSYNRVTSPYQDWDADALVSRRKEMLERVRALANGADVQAVLSEDAKFITEATRNNIKTTRDAIEWYNTERLKIQDALHEKHLTNTGDWMDPTGRKKREKTIKDEWSAYLNELDAYYTERKTRIQEAATEEGITEAEMKNRTLANEMEWHQRRAELQKLYARKSGEVTEEEQQAIFDILSERTGDTADFIQKTIGKTVKFIYDIGKHSEAEMRSIFGKLDKGIERDYLKQQQAVTTQMKAIRDIIEKERPYDGITRNLRENLVTMGILTADMTAERNRLMRENADMSDFNSRQAAEELKRTAFMLGEAEHAYSTTIEEVMRHMGEQGMQAWADAIRGDTQMQQALMAQLRTAYDEIQNAIKKEASLIKKQTDIWWADIAEGQTQSRRDGFEKALSRLGLAEDQVKRANSLIGAGQASERVADRLAIKQMQVRLAMQMTYYNRMRQIGEERIAQLKAEGRLEDAEHLRRSLNLAKTEELKKLEEQRVAIANQMEESQNRLYTALREWAGLLTSSLQSVFEASHAGDAEYYNELAKLNLTGKGGPGAGTYVIIDNAGTSKATAHYEYLDEFEALERQREIERHNAQAEAWKKVMDDINMRMSETITDQLNAMLQNASVDANTDATLANTRAILGLTEKIGGQAKGGEGIDTSSGTGMGLESGGVTGSGGERTGDIGLPPSVSDADPASFERYVQWVQTYNGGQEKMRQKTEDTNQKITASTQSAFAKMTQAANLYGIAYQAMSNDNLSAAQKFGMIAVQTAGQAAITSLTVSLSQQQGQAAADLPGVLGKIYKELGPIGGSIVFAAFTGLLGGLMGLAASKIAKSKSQIAQATGASGANAGRLTTGMLTYAEGNVNEFTDPASLQVGRQYNVDAADGKTYRARYMGRNPRTHLTNGPEFHLAGEAGREMIIDAGTTRQITMNEAEIWHVIQTLSGGGRIAATRRRGRGVRAFADGNLDEIMEDYGANGANETYGSGMSAEQMAALQTSIDRQSDLLQRALDEGIRGVFNVYGKDGLVDSYDRGKKTLNRYGERY